MEKLAWSGLSYSSINGLWTIADGQRWKWQKIELLHDRIVFILISKKNNKKQKTKAGPFSQTTFLVWNASSRNGRWRQRIGGGVYGTRDIKMSRFLFRKIFKSYF